MALNSLDPRVNRLPKVGQPGQINPKADLDQFGTFEVFVQPREGKPFQHEGIVHAPNLEMSYILAKEAFTRRFLCTSLYVADTRGVYVSPMTEGTTNVYDILQPVASSGQAREPFHIYHLVRRGKQHILAGVVEASSPAEAMLAAGTTLRNGKLVYNVWAIRASEIRFTSEHDADLWATLPEKTFRDAANYKGGDKLKDFLEKSKSN
jgi:ring-1,2-phenylacetyl-CoA epoxidase subunit PaaB